MRRTATMVTGAVVALIMVIHAAATAGELQMRSLDRFPFDTATARGLWAELQMGTAHTNDDSTGDVLTAAPVLAVGNDNWEGGAIVPYRRIEASTCSYFGCDEVKEDGIGDVQLYGKYVFRSQYVHLGVGVDFSVPSGDEEVGLGAGEPGIVPFGTAAVVLGPTQLRMHIGQIVYTASRPTSVGDVPADTLLWGAGLFWPISDIVGVRGELIGSKVDRDRNANGMSFEPGVDLRIAAGAVDFMVRPTAAFGLTDGAADWGVGGALAVLFEP